MKLQFPKLQQLADEHSDNLLTLFNLGIEGAQSAINLQAATMRHMLAAGAQQAPLLGNPSALAGNETLIGELVGSLVQDWTDFIQNSHGMTREAQEIARQMAESNLRALIASISESVAGFNSPTPVNQEAIDIAMRSWQVAAENAFAQAAGWQKQLEQASAQGSEVLATLAAKKPAVTSKRRTGSVSA